MTDTLWRDVKDKIRIEILRRVSFIWLSKLFSIAESEISIRYMVTKSSKLFFVGKIGDLFSLLNEHLLSDHIAIHTLKNHLCEILTELGRLDHPNFFIDVVNSRNRENFDAATHITKSSMSYI